MRSLSLSSLNFIMLFFAALTIAACSFSPAPPPAATPTVEQATETAVAQLPSPSPISEATLTAQPTTDQPILESPTPTFTPEPPTITPTASDTPGPYEHTIQQGETLGYIIQLYGYTDFSVIDQIVLINDNILNADSLPGAGSVILIPRQTATATPDLNDPTQVARLAANTPTIVAPGSAEQMCHTVAEGETIVGIASQYNTTLEVLAVLNPDLSFFTCNFTIPSGGPECNVLIAQDACVNVPMPTPTPTLSPTPSGQETATATPTYAPPMVVFPPQNAIAQGGGFRLQWVSVGELLSDEVYLVQIEDTTTGQSYTQVTRDTSLLMPESLVPADGQEHVINWRVTVARPNEAGVYRVVSGEAPVRTFRWR